MLRMVKCLHQYVFILILEKLYLICFFLSDPFLAISHMPCFLSPHLSPFILSSPPLFSPPYFIPPSLSLPSPDDSRTPALAQTWPTLMWNTRCAEEDEDEEVVGGGRRENQGWLSTHFQCNQNKMSTETTIVEQLFTSIS